MLLRIILLLLFLILAAPLRLVIRLQLQQGLHINVRAECWGIGGSKRLSILYTHEGIMLSKRNGTQRTLTSVKSQNAPLQRIFTQLAQDRSVLKYLIRHVHLLRLSVRLSAGGDAARACLATAAVRPLLQLLNRRHPAMHLQIEPAFTSPAQLQLQCILFLHLGTLLITALRLIASLLSPGQVQTREAYSYGTSHR